MKKPIIHNEFEQLSQEWFDFKLGKFGSTDAQAVATAGKGLETLCYKKTAEILSKTREDDYKNPDMERGIEQENLAVAAFELETGKSVKKVGIIELDDHTICSPDGIIDDDGLIEIKCQKNSVYVKSLYTKKIDSKYLWQMQHQLYVSGRKYCWFVVFSENFEGIIKIKIERDEAKIQKIKTGLTLGISKVKAILGKVK